MKKKLLHYLFAFYKKLQLNRNEFIFADSMRRFKSKFMDPKFESAKYEKEINPYFEKYGFRISRLEAEYFGRCSGVKSDLYIPVGMWSRFIHPYLNRPQFRVAYQNKNLFHRFLDIADAQKYVDILEPETVAYNDNGRFYTAEKFCSREEAISAVLNYGKDLIIKPTIESSHGHGIRKLHSSELSEDFLNKVFDEYDSNYTLQKVIIQHPNLAAYNELSVNTIRISTYQNPRGEVKVLYASQRFGEAGKAYDNADDPNGSGGFCKINEDGSVERDIHHYRNMRIDRLADSVPGVTPCFDKVVAAVKFLHTRFPQFAIIGWDMTVTPEGHPLVIEYNFAPGLGTCQYVHGPLFDKEDLDEIMSHVKKCKFEYVAKQLVSFPDKDSFSYLK